MAGVQVGRVQGGAFSSWSNGVRSLNYNFRAADTAVTRYLYHSGKGVVCPYPVLPDETRNFSWDTLPRRDFVTQKTLKSNFVTMWPSVEEDIVIKEVFAGPGGISVPWKFFHCVHDFYLNEPDWLAGEYLIWRPFDRTMKIYAVDIINLLVDGEEFNVNWKGDDKWAGIMSTLCATGGTPAQDIFTASNMEIWMKLRPETPPGVSVFLTGGSAVAEDTYFDPE